MTGRPTDVSSSRWILNTATLGSLLAASFVAARIYTQLINADESLQRDTTEIRHAVDDHEQRLRAIEDHNRKIEESNKRLEDNLRWVRQHMEQDR